MNIQNISNSGGAAYSPAAAFAGGGVAVAPASVVAVQAASVAPNPDEVKASVVQINKTIQSLTRNLEFTVDEGTKMNVVKVVDTQTKDVIRQFPSHEVLVIAKALDRLQGVLFRGIA